MEDLPIATVVFRACEDADWTSSNGLLYANCIDVCSGDNVGFWMDPLLWRDQLCRHVLEDKLGCCSYNIRYNTVAQMIFAWWVFCLWLFLMVVPCVCLSHLIVLSCVLWFALK